MELFAYALVFIALLFAVIQAVSSEDEPKNTPKRRKTKQPPINKKQPENKPAHRNTQQPPANKRQPENLHRAFSGCLRVS